MILFILRYNLSNSSDNITMFSICLESNTADLTINKEFQNFYFEYGLDIYPFMDGFVVETPIFI